MFPVVLRDALDPVNPSSSVGTHVLPVWRIDEEGHNDARLDYGRIDHQPPVSLSKLGAPPSRSVNSVPGQVSTGFKQVFSYKTPQKGPDRDWRRSL